VQASKSRIGFSVCTGNCGGPGEPTCEGGTTLRVATQEREKSLLEDFLDFAQKSDLPGIHYDPDVPDHLEMCITYGALLRLLAQWGLRARTGAAGSRMVTVSRWGRAGLQEGDWVMKGGATRWNYIRSFKWEPSSKIFGKYGNEFAPFRSGQTFEVPASAVRWPPISQFYKGFFGQRIFRP